MGIKKIFLIVLGCVGLALGAIGAVVPLMPAFPFLLLAAVCFAKSSDRLHNWFVSTALYKDNLESFIMGKGMTPRSKLRIMTVVTLTMGFGFFMMSNAPKGRVILSIVWVFHILYFIFGIKTISNESTAFCKRIIIGGLVCEDCARKLECAFNTGEGVRAEVQFLNRLAVIEAENSIEDSWLREIVTREGYIVEEIIADTKAGVQYD